MKEEKMEEKTAMEVFREQTNLKSQMTPEDTVRIAKWTERYPQALDEMGETRGYSESETRLWALLMERQEAVAPEYLDKVWPALRDILDCPAFGVAGVLKTPVDSVDGFVKSYVLEPIYKKADPRGSEGYENIGEVELRMKTVDTLVEARSWAGRRSPLHAILHNAAIQLTTAHGSEADIKDLSDFGGRKAVGPLYRACYERNFRGGVSFYFCDEVGQNSLPGIPYYVTATLDHHVMTSWKNPEIACDAALLVALGTLFVPTDGTLYTEFGISVTNPGYAVTARFER